MLIIIDCANEVPVSIHFSRSLVKMNVKMSGHAGDSVPPSISALPTHLTVLALELPDWGLLSVRGEDRLKVRLLHAISVIFDTEV